MLVLTRKVNQTIHVGSSIRIKVVSLQGNRVRIGIDAPHHVPISRCDSKYSDKHEADAVDRPSARCEIRSRRQHELLVSCEK